MPTSTQVEKKILGCPYSEAKKFAKNIISHRKIFTSYKTVRFESRFVRQFYGDTFLLSDILTSEKLIGGQNNEYSGSQRT